VNLSLHGYELDADQIEAATRLRGDARVLRGPRGRDGRMVWSVTTPFVYTRELDAVLAKFLTDNQQRFPALREYADRRGALMGLSVWVSYYEEREIVLFERATLAALAAGCFDYFEVDATGNLGPPPDAADIGYDGSDLAGGEP
jgi:hypothetical protein